MTKIVHDIAQNSMSDVEMMLGEIENKTPIQIPYEEGAWADGLAERLTNILSRPVRAIPECPRNALLRLIQLASLSDSTLAEEILQEWEVENGPWVSHSNRGI